MNKKNAIKPIAFYLPQFHAIPENDKWWGKGFTEWTNVRKAKPLFKGHYQPRIPADEIGYYDLMKDKNIFQKQIKLAKEHGIYGFCFYHYWFRGKKLLEKPVERFLNEKTLDFNFCLSWSNGNWTKRWDGLESDVLQKQDYGKREDWIEHFNYLIPFFEDDRYIKIDGKPIVLIYSTGRIKNFNEIIGCWREQATKRGLDGIYVISTLNCYDDSYVLYDKDVDAACEFPPFSVRDVAPRVIIDGFSVFDYGRVVTNALANKKKYHSVQFKGVSPGWDNAARGCRGGRAYHRPTPEKFKHYVRMQALNTVKELPVGKRFLFINAWNEWAEGAYLEPDKKFGRGYLEAIKEALAKEKSLVTRFWFMKNLLKYWTPKCTYYILHPQEVPAMIRRKLNGPAKQKIRLSVLLSHCRRQVYKRYCKGEC